MHLTDPFPDAEWEIWHKDTFDRECPRQVETAGLGLAKGLVELWARYLLETVQANEQGVLGFARFGGQEVGQSRPSLLIEELLIPIKAETTQREVEATPVANQQRIQASRKQSGLPSPLGSGGWNA